MATLNVNDWHVRRRFFEETYLRDKREPKRIEIQGFDNSLMVMADGWYLLSSPRDLDIAIARGWDIQMLSKSLPILKGREEFAWFPLTTNLRYDDQAREFAFPTTYFRAHPTKGKEEEPKMATEKAPDVLASKNRSEAERVAAAINDGWLRSLHGVNGGPILMEVYHQEPDSWTDGAFRGSIRLGPKVEIKHIQLDDLDKHGHTVYLLVSTALEMFAAGVDEGKVAAANSLADHLRGIISPKA